MATKKNKIEVEITAVDEATPKIERLEKKIDGMEADEARLTVTADTERLERQLAAAKASIDGLEGDELTVQARMVGNLETDLEQAQTLLRELDGKTGTVKLNATDSASGDIDRVETKLRQLDGETATVRVDTPGAAATGLDVATGAKGLAGVAAVGAVTEMARAANDAALNVAQLRDMTGSTTEQASQLLAVWEAQGFEAADLMDIILNLNGVLADQPELADKLKIADSNNLIDTFLEAVQGVSAEYDNAGERARVASQLFGEEGVRQVGRVTTSVGDLSAAVADTEPLISDTDIDNAREMNAQTAELEGRWRRIQQEAARQLVPVGNQALSGESAWRMLFGFGLGDKQVDQLIARIFGSNSVSQPNPGLDAVIARNTGGYVGGAQIGGTGGLIAGHPGAPGANVTIVNPPGTPPATVDLSRLYDERNGSRS